MPQINDIGKTWNLPNYAGELFTSDATQTPLLSMIGGLTGGKITKNFEFPTAVLYDYPAAEQPSISEDASIIAPTPKHIARTQDTNVVQIHQEAIDLTYMKQSNMGRMSGINSADVSANPPIEKDWQIQQKLIKIARDVEHTFINGEYQLSTGAGVANKTRGMLEVCEMSNSIVAPGVVLSKAILNTLYRMLADSGAYFSNMVMFVSATQKQILSDVYANQFNMVMPSTRNIGGVNITEIETDFFKMGVAWNRFLPADTVLLVDVAHISPVFQEVPNKGILFEEELAKIGASDRVQIYGQIGLAHGATFLHGAIKGLAT